MDGGTIFWIVFLFVVFGGSIGEGARRILRELQATRREVQEQKAKREREAIEGPQPICGCGHHYAYHDPASGECHHKVQHVLRKVDGHVTKWEMVQCDCRVYVGPQPLQVFHAPLPSQAVAVAPDDLEHRIAQAEQASKTGLTKNDG